MFPHHPAKGDSTAGLSADLGVHVLLVGLTPVYAHGLHVGLTDIGLRCTVVPTTDEPGPPLESGLTAVAVLPASNTATVETTDGVPLAAVHVLAESSVQAYSDALRAGATSAFERDAELPTIVQAVLCAGLGLTVLPVEVARALSRQAANRRPQLTDRDRQYLRMLASGATVASVGRRFALSERETFRRLSGTYQRLGARNRTEAMLLAQRFGVLEEGT